MLPPFCMKWGVRIFIINPRIDDDLALGVIAKQQTVLLKEFGSEPVLVFVTECTALPVLNTSWILGGCL